MITKTVIQSSSWEDVRKTLLHYLHTADSSRKPQMNSLWVFSLFCYIILYTIKIKMGLHNANATVIQTQHFFCQVGFSFMKFHFRINFDINVCQAVEIELNQVSLFLFELT